jgi:hypothetical protein
VKIRVAPFVMKRWKRLVICFCIVDIQLEFGLGWWWFFTTVSMSYAMLVGCKSNKKRRKGLPIAWLAFFWVVWKVRNDRVCNNITVEVLAAVELI